MTAAALLTGLAYGLLWLFAGLIVALILGALILGACIPHADRDCDSEETEAQPISETGRISFFHVVGDTDV